MENLRKFSLEFCDLPTMLENVDTLLRLVNVKINKYNDGRINIVLYIVWIACTICYYYISIFSTSWFMFVYSPRTGDFIAASVVFSLSVCSQPSFINMFYMIMYKKKVQNLIQSYLNLNDLVKPGSTFEKNLQIQLRSVKRRARTVWITMITNGLIYVTIPILMPGRHLTEDLQVIYGLEPMFESPNFEIASVMMGVSICICVFSLANITALNLVILGYNESQMVALSKELRQLWHSAEDFSSQNSIFPHNSGTDASIINAYIKERLKEIIYLHIRNINIIEEYENVFRVTKAIAIIFLIMGIISELLGGIENTYMQIPFTFVLILMECSAGQKLMDACEMFERAAYGCNWEMFDIGNRKTVLMMIVSAQKTLCISAGGMATMNFSCLLSVMKFTYSIYNTLRLVVK